jgi:SP family general alpha glucoside:H+ symporter-like MFS transporter
MEEIESKQHHALEIEQTAVYAEKAEIAAYRAGAIEAENVEHNMTVLQAVKAYPMASFWAFVMSCTIVSCLLREERCS